MVDAYRTPTPPDPEDLEEEEQEEEEEIERPEPPNFPTFWIALVFLAVEGTIYFFAPQQGTIVLAMAFNVVVYALFRINIAYSQSKEYEERMKVLQAEAKARATKAELTETKYERAAFKAFMRMCTEHKVLPEEMLKKYSTVLSPQEVGPAVAYIQSKSHA